MFAGCPYIISDQFVFIYLSTDLEISTYNCQTIFGSVNPQTKQLVTKKVEMRPQGEHKKIFGAWAGRAVATGMK